MPKTPPTFHATEGVVYDTNASSYTNVHGQGAGAIYNGTGSIETYVSSTTTHTRDVWLTLTDGSQAHRRYFADVPIRKGQRIIEISLTDSARSIPFAIFFPETKSSWLINKKGFNQYSKSIDVTLFKTFIAFWVFGAGVSALDYVTGVPSSVQANLIIGGTIAYFIYDLIRTNARESKLRQELETAYSRFLQNVTR